MARPEQSCHPETLLTGAHTVVSAASCYWAPEAPLEPGEGRLARYTWADAYERLREQLDALGRRLGGRYRVLVDANQHVGREAAALVSEYDRLYVPRNDARWLRRNALGALGNTGGGENVALLERYAAGDDQLLGEHASWALERVRERA